MSLRPFLSLFTALCLAFALLLAPPASARTADERQSRASELISALGGTAQARSEWLKRWAAPQKREELAKRLEAIAIPELNLGETDFSRPSDRIYVAANKSAARIDLLPEQTDPEMVGGIFAFPWPAEYDRDVSSLSLRDDAALRSEIDRRVRYSVDRGDFSGAVLVIRGGKPIYAGAFGLADRDHEVANSLDTRFHLGSMDKMFTSVAIGQLIEAGKLSLDSKLIEILPDYPNAKAARAITVRHLLSHSAGLGSWFGRPAYDRDTRYRRMGEWLPVFASEPLEFQPGERSSYSNEGYVLLGAIVEKLSGQSWYDYVRKNIFDPVGMKDTGYPALDEVVAGRAVGYLIPADSPFAREPRKPNWMLLGYRGGSLGGGYSTVADMARFLSALREGRLMSRSSAELFTSAAEPGLRNYGFGFQNQAAGARTIRGHDGGGPGSGINSDAKIIWETGDVYAVLGNYDAPFAQNLGSDIAKMLAAMP